MGDNNNHSSNGNLQYDFASIDLPTKQQELVLALESAVLQLDGLESTMNEESRDLLIERFTKINMTLVATFMARHDEEDLPRILSEKIVELNDLIIDIFPESEGPLLIHTYFSRLKNPSLFSYIDSFPMSRLSYDEFPVISMIGSVITSIHRYLYS